MLVYCRVSPNIKINICRYPFTHLGGERHCLAQEHSTMSLARTPTQTTQSGGKHTNCEATMPPQYGQIIVQWCILSPVIPLHIVGFKSWRSHHKIWLHQWWELQWPSGYCLCSTTQQGGNDNNSNYFFWSISAESSAGSISGILNPWIWLANSACSSGLDFLIQTPHTDRS